MNLADVFPPKDKVQRLYCDKCHDYLDLSFTDFSEDVSGISISISGLPVLHCKNCSATFLPDDSRFAIIYLHQQATEGRKSVVAVTRKKTNQDFGFTKVQFVYDSDDYKYIPGLSRPFQEGFLTPVFFNREVLIKYDASPVYRVRFASKTYGEIRQGHDFAISFGLNRNSKLLMWLGDIAKLPETEQYYLRSENIPSDHSIGSEFYDGQIECIFTEHSPEDELFKDRSTFLEACFRRFGKKLAQLDKEVLDLAVTVQRPLVDSARARRDIADILNKIYIESFDNKALGEALYALGEDAKSLKSLKRVQKLLQRTSPTANISKMMSPFYVLYDLRVAYSHLASEEGSREILKHVQERLALDQSTGLLNTYDRLIAELSTAFKKITAVVDDGP
jgi:hypothetical protein